MKWVELKMGQLGVLNNPNYKITALVDSLAMITVQSDTRGTFDCKPLGVIWAKFSEVHKFSNCTNNLNSLSLLSVCLGFKKINSRDYLLCQFTVLQFKKHHYV